MKKFLLFAVLFCNPCFAESPTPLNLYDIEQELISYTNSERIKAGLAPLIADHEMMEFARKHTQYMCNTYSFNHSNGPYAENIAMGNSSAKDFNTTWMNSSSHREHILRSTFRRIGVAIFRSKSGTLYATQVFRGE